MTPVVLLHKLKWLGLFGVIAFGALPDLGNEFRRLKTVITGANRSAKTKKVAGRATRVLMHSIDTA